MDCDNTNQLLSKQEFKKETNFTYVMWEVFKDTPTKVLLNALAVQSVSVVPVQDCTENLGVLILQKMHLCNLCFGE